jgi:NAD(P)-dependent dehydrogenase (short-subunit alcohol dehydrogenase family)
VLHHKTLEDTTNLTTQIMDPSNQPILVFGPTGAVGNAAAIESHKRGAHVYLAMRNTTKEIKHLSASDLSSPRYTKIQADLNQPATLKQSVHESGATTAFIYTILSCKDNMRATFSALKDSGIEHVVLLSSYAVKGPAEDEKNM